MGLNLPQLGGTVPDNTEKVLFGGTVPMDKTESLESLSKEIQNLEGAIATLSDLSQERERKCELEIGTVPPNTSKKKLESVTVMTGVNNNNEIDTLFGKNGSKSVSISRENKAGTVPPNTSKKKLASVRVKPDVKKTSKINTLGGNNGSKSDTTPTKETVPPTRENNRLLIETV